MKSYYTLSNASTHFMFQNFTLGPGCKATKTIHLFAAIDNMLMNKRLYIKQQFEM